MTDGRSTESDLLREANKLAGRLDHLRTRPCTMQDIAELLGYVSQITVALLKNVELGDSLVVKTFERRDDQLSAIEARLADAEKANASYAAVCDRMAEHLAAAEQASFAAGRFEGLEVAAKVARSFDKSLISMTREDVQACEIEAAIRALMEKPDAE